MIFPILRNYRTDAHTDTVLREVIRQLEAGEAHSCSEGEFYQECVLASGHKARWWSANRYYAYADQGTVASFSWNKRMPSRRTAKKLDHVFREAMAREMLEGDRT